MLLKLGWNLVKAVPRLAVAGAVGGVAWSAFGVDHATPFRSPLPGARLSVVDPQGGFVALYHDDGGEGRPVLLVHSVNAAASAFEMSPLYTRLQGTRPVWAIDLPGYGGSERGDRSYTPVLMAGAIGAALEHTGPAHVVALSLGCEFAARAAVDRPDLVESLTLLSPTGFGTGQGTPAWLGTVVRLQPVSQAMYDGLTSRPSIRYYLNKSFAGPVDEALVEYDYMTSHQPEARYAPFAFLAGELFTPNVAGSIYAQVETPTSIIYDRDPFSGFVRLPEFLAGRDGWRAARIPGTIGLPHWDRPAETLDEIEKHWSTVDGKT